MTFLKIGLALTLMTLCLATAAEAKGAGLGGFGGQSEQMEFVASFAGPTEEAVGKPLSLCHLINKRHAFFIPYLFESRGYVLAENRCDTDRYVALTPEAFAEARAAGFIPADTPDQPSLSQAQQMAPVLSGLVAALAILWALRSKFRARARASGMNGLPGHVQRVLDVACHAAKASGEIGNQKINMIAEIVERTTDVKVDSRKIRQVVANCESSLQHKDFARFSSGLAIAQKELLLKVALIVVGSDGAFDRVEKKFLAGLAAGLGITQSRFDNLVQTMR